MEGVGIVLLPNYFVDREEKEGLITSNLDWTPNPLSFFVSYIDRIESSFKLMIINKIIKSAINIAQG